MYENIIQNNYDNLNSINNETNQKNDLLNGMNNLQIYSLLTDQGKQELKSSTKFNEQKSEKDSLKKSIFEEKKPKQQIQNHQIQNQQNNAQVQLNKYYNYNNQNENEYPYFNDETTLGNNQEYLNFMINKEKDNKEEYSVNFDLNSEYDDFNYIYHERQNANRMHR